MASPDLSVSGISSQVSSDVRNAARSRNLEMAANARTASKRIRQASPNTALAFRRARRVDAFIAVVAVILRLTRTASGPAGAAGSFVTTEGSGRHERSGTLLRHRVPRPYSHSAVRVVPRAILVAAAALLGILAAIGADNLVGAHLRLGDVRPVGACTPRNVEVGHAGGLGPSPTDLRDRRSGSDAKKEAGCKHFYHSNLLILCALGAIQWMSL